MWVSGRTVSRPLCGCQISKKWRKTTSAAEQRRRRLKCGILVLGVYTAPLWADTLSGRAGGMRQCVYYWLSCWRSQWQQHTQWNRQERRRLFRRAAVALIQGREMSESNTPETNTCPSFFSIFHYQLVDVYLVLEREWFKQFQTPACEMNDSQSLKWWILHKPTVHDRTVVTYCESGSYFHLYDGLQGLGFAGILVQLVSSVQFLSEKRERRLHDTMHSQFISAQLMYLLLKCSVVFLVFHIIKSICSV